VRNIIHGLALIAGGALILAGFIVFQWVQFLNFGQTGLQIVLENQQSLPSQIMLQPQQPIWSLWLILITALAALLTGWWLLRSQRRRTILTVLLFALAVVTLYPFWMTYTSWSVDFANTTELLAPGYWLALAGTLLVGVSALSSSR
jgi:glucan phosphoethanolaminetransferase (alkaline phosphatase superfamily)